MPCFHVCCMTETIVAFVGGVAVGTYKHDKARPHFDNAHAKVQEAIQKAKENMNNQPTPSPSIQVNVLSLSGDALDLVVVPQTRVAELKVSIMDWLHVPLVCQNLAIGTTVLNDDDMVGDHAHALGVPLAVSLAVSYGDDRNQKLIITQALAHDIRMGNQEAIACVSMYLSDCDDAVSGAAAEELAQSLLKCEAGVAMTALSTARAYLADCDLTRAAVLPVGIMLALASAKARLIDCEDSHLPLPFRLRLAAVSHGAGTLTGEDADRQVSLKGLLEIPREALLEAIQEFAMDASTFRPVSFGLVCFAVAGLSGSMDEDTEKDFFVSAFRHLLTVFESGGKKKEQKVLVVSWMFYILVNYPKFLEGHYKFLLTGINRLREFMHDDCPIAREMAVNYFLQVCQCSGHKLAVLQKGHDEPFIQELVRNLRRDVCAFEADGGHDEDAGRRDDLFKMYVEALTLIINQAEDKEFLLTQVKVELKLCTKSVRWSDLDEAESSAEEEEGSCSGQAWPEPEQRAGPALARIVCDSIYHALSLHRAEDTEPRSPKSPKPFKLAEQRKSPLSPILYSPKGPK